MKKFVYILALVLPVIGYGQTVTSFKDSTTTPNYSTSHAHVNQEAVVTYNYGDDASATVSLTDWSVDLNGDGVFVSLVDGNNESGDTIENVTSSTFDVVYQSSGGHRVVIKGENGDCYEETVTLNYDVYLPRFNKLKIEGDRNVYNDRVIIDELAYTADYSDVDINGEASDFNYTWTFTGTDEGTQVFEDETPSSILYITNGSKTVTLDMETEGIVASISYSHTVSINAINFTNPTWNIVRNMNGTSEVTFTVDVTPTNRITGTSTSDVNYLKTIYDGVNTTYNMGGWQLNQTHRVFTKTFTLNSYVSDEELDIEAKTGVFTIAGGGINVSKTETFTTNTPVTYAQYRTADDAISVTEGTSDWATSRTTSYTFNDLGEFSSDIEFTRTLVSSNGDTIQPTTPGGNTYEIKYSGDYTYGVRRMSNIDNTVKDSLVKTFTLNNENVWVEYKEVSRDTVCGGEDYTFEVIVHNASNGDGATPTIDLNTLSIQDADGLEIATESFILQSSDNNQYVYSVTTHVLASETRIFQYNVNSVTSNGVTANGFGSYIEQFTTYNVVQGVNFSSTLNYE